MIEGLVGGWITAKSQFRWQRNHEVWGDNNDGWSATHDGYRQHCFHTRRLSFFCLVRHQNLGKTFSNMVICKKMHAWLISETSNLDFRKDEKKGAFAVFFLPKINFTTRKQTKFLLTSGRNVTHSLTGQSVLSDLRFQGGQEFGGRSHGHTAHIFTFRSNQPASGNRSTTPLPEIDIFQILTFQGQIQIHKYEY